MAIFDEKIEIRERCKGVHCVDLGESFPTSIYLQKSASIQPRTSPSKFGEKFNSLFTSLLSGAAGGGPDAPSGVSLEDADDASVMDALGLNLNLCTINLEVDTKAYVSLILL